MVFIIPAFVINGCPTLWIENNMAIMQFRIEVFYNTTKAAKKKMNVVFFENVGKSYLN